MKNFTNINDYETFVPAPKRMIDAGGLESGKSIFRVLDRKNLFLYSLTHCRASKLI